jgi:hypothetical protein
MYRRSQLEECMSKMSDIHITAQEIARDYGLPASDTIVNAIGDAALREMYEKAKNGHTLSSTLFDI